MGKLHTATGRKKMSMQSNMKDKILELGRHSISSEDYDILHDTAKGSDLVVEIGSRYGCSTMLFGKIAKKVISVESDPLPELYSNMAEMEIKNWRLINTYSPYMEIEEDIDYYFIDGDHRTIFCIADYVKLAPFVKVGGKIAFHDTEHHECEAMVNRAVDIILEESKNLKEIARNTKSPGMVVFEKTRMF